VSGSRRTALYAADAGGTGPAVFSIPKLQTRIDRLAFKGEDTEDAFVDAPKRFLADESFQGFDT
jgi:hypothetical protein